MKGANFKTFFRIATIGLISALVVIFLILGERALALETGLNYGTIIGLGTADIRVVIMRIIQILLGFIGIVVLILILYGGYVWMTSGGDANKIAQAKKILVNAAIGLLIILLAFAIVTFIINQLISGIIGGPPGPPPPPGGCVNCGALGGGIIKSVYPAPGAVDVPRDTNIYVTFKEPMAEATIIDTDGTILTEAIKIYRNDDPDNFLDAEAVGSLVGNEHTFVFNPVDYLGDGQNHLWYTVKLDSAIKKADGKDAFKGFPGYFSWSFEVGTKLDLQPPKVINVFPIPDNLADTYSTTPAQQASGTIRVLSQPKVAQQAGVGPVITPPNSPAPPATVVGTYNGSYTGQVSVTINSPADTATVFWATGNPNNNNSAATVGNTVTLGAGLILSIDESFAAGNQWTFNVTAAQKADTLKVSNITYTFVSSSPTGDQIEVGATLYQTAANIASKVQTDIQSPNVLATVISSDTINLIAEMAGRRGNNIMVLASGDWHKITPMAGGLDEATSAKVLDKPDQPRNAIIRMDFSEAMDPINVSGEALTDDTNVISGMGSLGVNDFSQITIQADVDNSGTFENDEYIAGTFTLSNQYKTVEFISLAECQDEQGNPIENSCGDVIYCLPVGSQNATKYKVNIQAGLLENCADNTDCQDSNFGSCVDLPNPVAGKVCNSQVDGSGLNYPKAQTVAAGVIDASNNSLDGNKNNNAQGPQSQSNQPAYDLNNPNAGSQGDDLLWSFYINDQIDLTAPQVVAIKPTIGQIAVGLLEPLEATFDKLMMSATLKPGSGYQPDPDEKFVSLIDYSANPVGWWVSDFGDDTSQPPDGYFDRSVAQISHSSFAEVTNYSAELGSGIRDIYQNCYLPSEGPAAGQSSSNRCAKAGITCTSNNDCSTEPNDYCACGTTRANPYCCEGVPSVNPCR